MESNFVSSSGEGGVGIFSLFKVLSKATEVQLYHRMTGKSVKSHKTDNLVPPEMVVLLEPVITKYLSSNWTPGGEAIHNVYTLDFSSSLLARHFFS